MPYLCLPSLTFFACCICSASDVISTGVQDSPAEPPLQVFSAGKDGGAEGSVRLPLQGFAGAEDKQEAGKDTRGSLPCCCDDDVKMPLSKLCV